MNNGNFREFAKGIIKQNPVFVSLLGMCPTLAVTGQAVNGLGMGIATTFVLFCSNTIISFLKDVIPKEVKLPCYIVIIAGFVTIAEFLLHGFIPSLYESLGTFLSLITVNCIILGRAEMFASKNKVLPSMLDALGMGMGFTFALFFIGSVREILGSGQWFGIDISISENIKPMTVFVMPAGGFFVLGCIIALLNKIAGKKPPQRTGCAGCPNSSKCFRNFEEEASEK